MRAQTVELGLVFGDQLAEQRMDAIVLEIRLERVDEQGPGDLVAVLRGEDPSV